MWTHGEPAPTLTGYFVLLQISAFVTNKTRSNFNQTLRPLFLLYSVLFSSFLYPSSCKVEQKSYHKILTFDLFKFGFGFVCVFFWTGWKIAKKELGRNRKIDEEMWKLISLVGVQNLKEGEKKKLVCPKTKWSAIFHNAKQSRVFVWSRWLMSMWTLTVNDVMIPSIRHNLWRKLGCSLFNLYADDFFNAHFLFVCLLFNSNNSSF